MCGIIGIVGNQPVTRRLIDGLRRLEYRGYDSAGIALIEKNADGARLESFAVDVGRGEGVGREQSWAPLE